MSEQEALVARSYRPGAWFAVVGPRALVVLPPSERARVAALWELVDEGAGFDVTLDALIADGLRALSGFVLVATEDGTTKVVLRGPATATFVAAGGPVVLEGGAATTWVERSLTGVRRMTIRTEEEHAYDGDGSPRYSLEAGLVRVSRIDEPRDDLPAPDADPGPVAASSAPLGPPPSGPPPSAPPPSAPPPSGPPPSAPPSAPPLGPPPSGPPSTSVSPSPSGPPLGPPPTSPPVMPPVVVPAPPAPPATPAPPTPPDLPADLPAPPPPPPPPPPAEPEPESEPVAREPEMGSELVAPEPDAEPEVGPAESEFEPAGRELEPELEPVVPEPQPHPVPGFGPREPEPADALTGELPVDPDAPTGVMAVTPPAPAPPAHSSARPPVARLHFSHGDVVDVDRAILVGRAPEARRFTVSDQPRLVTVPSPHQEISSTHLEVRPGSGADQGSAVVTDLGSTNGTVLVQPGRPPEELQAGVAVQLLPGALIDLGDGVSIQVVVPG